MCAVIEIGKNLNGKSLEEDVIGRASWVYEDPEGKPMISWPPKDKQSNAKKGSIPVGDDWVQYPILRVKLRGSKLN